MDKDTIKFFCGLTAFIASGMFIIDMLMMRECTQFQAVTGKNARYVHLSACYVEQDGTFMHWQEYKAYITAKALKE